MRHARLRISLDIADGRNQFSGSVSMSDNIRFVIVGALALITILHSGCKTGSNSSASSSPQQASVPTVSPKPTVRQLECPPLGSILVQAPPSTNGHRVTLKWRASRLIDVKQAGAAGYCIYRGPKPEAPSAELVNHLPFTDTKCVDDSVENGRQYYYVVRAISARGVTSVVSKPPVRVRIPDTPRVSKVRDDSTPLCREAAGIKGP